MGFLEVLTIIFIVLKLLGVIAWSWWIVLLPAIIAVGIYVTIYVIAFVSIIRTKREIEKVFEDDPFFK